MRWVTVATEDGPRACGVLNGQYVDVNAADREMPATVRELLELGPDWQRRAWGALPKGVLRHDPANVTLLRAACRCRPSPCSLASTPRP
jgi:hypothetical protein